MNKEIEITISEYNVHIENSYLIRNPFKMNKLLKDYRSTSVSKVFDNRSNYSLIREWVSHNNAYMLHFKRDRYCSVDLNYPQRWWVKCIYFICSLIIL